MMQQIIIRDIMFLLYLPCLPYIAVDARYHVTGTCFIQKIYAPLLFLTEGAYIFWMKQVPVRAIPGTILLMYFFSTLKLSSFFFKQSILKSFRIIISNLNYQFVDPRPVTAYWWRHRFLNPWSIVTTRPFSLPCKYYLFAGSYLQCRENGRVATIESLVC